MNTLLPIKCPTCEGTGWVKTPDPENNNATTLWACRKCGGEGHLWKAPKDPYAP